MNANSEARVGKRVSSAATKEKQKKSTKDLAQEYSKYFVPQNNTPESFQIFTLTNWSVLPSTGNHT